jgi:hypothetical protein
MRSGSALGIILVASLAANVVLGMRRPAPEQWQGVPAAPARAPGGSGAGVAVDTVRCERAGTLLALEQRAMAEARTALADYWGADYEARYAAVMFRLTAGIREALIAQFGDSARDEPQFRRLFYPLDAVLPFLSPDQQLALQHLRFERDQRLRADAGHSPTPPAINGPPSSASSTVPAAEAEFRRALSDLLGPDALFELELRDSAIARQLRSSGVGLSESEFRRAFEVLRALEGQPGSIESALAARAALRDLLGDRRFAELWSARDPKFAVLAQIAARHELGDARLLTVYSLLGDFEDRRMRAALIADRDPERASRQMQRIADEERAELVRQLGEDVADDLLRGRAAQSLRVFGQGL